MTAVHAFADDALGDSDATDLAGRLAEREVSPAELVEAAVARAERMQPLLNGFAFTAYDAARRAAAGRVPGFFGGVPTAVKDNTDVAGMPTQHGSAAWRAAPARHDSPFTTQLISTGLVPLGKSRLPEFGFNASTEYLDGDPVRNPWNLDYSPGASSGGSAALVASGVVPLAHANDGGGSIRIPAAACGLVGLKPTRGRLLLDPIMARMPVPIVANGVVTRSVRDTAAFLREAERHHRALSLPPIGDVRGPSRRRLRVGLLLDSVAGHPTDEATRAVVSDAATLLESLGHRVDEAVAPVTDRFVDDFTTYWSLLGFFLVHSGRRSLAADFDATLVDNLTAGLARHFRRRAHTLPGVVRRLRATRKLSADAFRDHDVLLTPTLAHTTPRLGHLSPHQPFEEHLARLQRYVQFTPLQNASGDPAISLPFGQADGLPVGVHLVAPWGCERTLLEVAFELEEARPWARIQDVVPAC